MGNKMFIIFGECKWKDNVNPTRILTNLKKKAENVNWKNKVRKEKYVVFARSFGKKSHDEDVILFDSRALEKMF